MRSIICSFVIASLALAGCGGSSSDDAAPQGAAGGNVRLVAYSTPREAYAKLIDLYKSGSGEGVEFDQSYGASGEQSRAVEAGLKADVVAFSLEPDMTRLVEGDLVPTDWNAGEHKGMVTDSVVVFVVRDGNPKGIHGWDDLVKEGVEVVTPNPFTSGGARWNVMAGYGAQLEQGKTEEQARDYLTDLFHNVTVQDKSARESLTTFAAGKGDVLLAYENEAIFAKRQGQPFEYVVPDQTILIENPVAATKDASAAGKGSSTSSSRTRLRRCSATRATARSRRPCSTRSTSRRLLRSSRSPTSAAGTACSRSSSTARTATWPRCRRRSGSRPSSARASASSAPAAAAAGRRRTPCR